MNMLDTIQLLSVFFGTLIAAPLIVSKKAKKRLFGLMAVITGSFFAIIVQLYLGLYYFVFEFITNFFGLLLIGPFKKFKNVDASKVAKCIVDKMNDKEHGARYLTFNDFKAH